ncbi:carbon starvation protein A, partial [Vibrio chemaguriensis]|nr:carbon starvation protein A [Vibrio chemaguriensis]
FILNNSSLGFGLPMQVSTIAGVIFSLVVTGYVIKTSKGKGESELADEEKPQAVTETA